MKEIWIKEKIVKTLQNLFKNQIVTVNLLQKYSKQHKICDIGIINKKFHNLENACKKAKISYINMNFYVLWNKKKIIKTLQVLFKNKIVTGKLVNEYFRKGKICEMTTIRKRFGSLKNACIEANISFKNERAIWSKTQILDSLIDLYNKNGQYRKVDLLSFRKEGKICDLKVIRREFNSLDEAAEQAGIEFDKRKDIRWKEKEDFGIELCKEIYGEGQVNQYYKNIGFPDFVPNNLQQPIIDIKSRVFDCSIQQKEKYERIRKDVKFMVFENIGITDVPDEKIIYMKEVIRKLPNNKKIVFQERYERIKSNIPIEQKNIQTFVKQNEKGG